MLTITSISLISDPITTIVENTEYPSHLHHALLIDLKPVPNTNLSSFRNHLRRISNDHIDMIKFHGDTPSLAIWESVQDFKHISHLEMISGFDEVCNIAPLDEISCTRRFLYCCGLSFHSISLDGPSQLNELIIFLN
ncbi:unnamed protein product [Adineta ricciae]|uniref:Uncharacterized protein n=1 Tax=Adineta ricciae TaxID=249248 RepID=A0A815EWC4_ADIRI|nr:unnamed protein product [Adineta ricciae]CAF1507743.1 unnamed protein product [Adineta ricciae]